MLDLLTIVIYCHHVYQKHFHYGNILQESYIIHNVISVFAKEEITITIAHTQGFWNSAETFDSSSKLYYYSKKNIYILIYFNDIWKMGDSNNLYFSKLILSFLFIYE